MDFVATQDFVTPYVVSTGQPHNPTQICKKKFRKGDIITGEVKTVKGKPSFVLHKGVMVIPFSVVKQVVVKDIVISNLDGSTDAVAKTNPKVEVKVIKPADVKNKKYIDGILIGAVVGLGGVILAEKQGWIVNIDKKNKIYGAIAGAVLGAYYIYRFKK
jgi:hypothetical protein